MFSPANVHAIISTQTVQFCSPRVFYVPMRRHQLSFCFCFLSDFSSVKIFRKMGPTLDQTILSKKSKMGKKKTGDPGQALGWASITCMQNFRVYLSKTEWIFELSCAKMSNLRYFLQISRFYCGIQFLFARFCFMLNTGRSDLRILGEKLCRDTPWSKDVDRQTLDP